MNRFVLLMKYDTHKESKYKMQIEKETQTKKKKQIKEFEEKSKNFFYGLKSGAGYTEAQRK